MRFSELVDQAVEFLRQRERVSYRALKREFDLDDETLEDLKTELIDARRVAGDEEGKVLVWAGNGSPESRVQSPNKAKGKRQKAKGEGEVVSPQLSVVSPQPLAPSTQPLPAERRQLTVLFCDLVGSTALSAQLDPEDYRAVVQRYQQTCTEVIQRHEGYLAQYLGDGLLVYFGYPTAHEDDARRAVRTGLEIVEAIRGQGTGNREQERQQPLQVRIGIHTGLVVVGEIGSKEKRELLALGETPNLAARIQGLAEPNTVLISAATQRLITGFFECQPFGSHLVKGIDTPIAVYHVESERQDVSPLTGRVTLTPLVGREQEVGLLIDHWEQVKEGRGQVVLLSGEPGIGKSRLAYTLKEHITSEGSLLYEARCSPYHQHSALYPLIEVLQRTLLLTRQDTDDEKVQKLERVLALYGMEESLPLFTALLSLPTPVHYPPLNFTPQKQKERTLQALVQLLVAQAERQATVSVWEDLHWADPSSLEFLNLLVEQVPTTKLLLVLTFRPEFTPSWKPYSHISHLVLNRLGKKQVEAMIEKVTQGKTLSAEIIEQIRAKTDGVPLFVEELTKSVLESVASRESKESRESPHRTPHQLAIPATLQEALLARLDRLSTARQIAQLGATLGREFSYELLHAVAPTSEPDLQAALTKLVEAEILYQRGIGPKTRYFFKHALVQETAYQSLLKSTRQQYHQQIAQILEGQFVGTVETQPEFLAHHYMEAGLIGQALPYLQIAGQKAVQRSAHLEAINHLTAALELLKTLPDTPERDQQELRLQMLMGGSLIATKGYSSPEVGKTFSRAQELCRQIGETPQLFPILRGLRLFYSVRGEHRMGQELGEQLMNLAQSRQDTAHLLEAHAALVSPLFWLGELTLAREQAEQGIALYDPVQHRSHAVLYGQDPGVNCLIHAALVLLHLGYQDQARQRVQEALTLAQELSHPYSLAYTLFSAACVYGFLQEEQAVLETAEAAIALSTDQGFPVPLMVASVLRGWALAAQGEGERGIAEMHQNLASLQAIGLGMGWSFLVAHEAEMYGKGGEVEKGLARLTEAFVWVKQTAERSYEAELYRLRGQLTLQHQFKVQSSEFKIPSPQHPTPSTHAEAEAEACFLKAIDIARKQQAKSWELRASTSLARLWQSQGKRTEAHKLLSEIYNWFTEGFDTKDLQEAKGLVDELAEG